MPPSIPSLPQNAAYVTYNAPQNYWQEAIHGGKTPAIHGHATGCAPPRQFFIALIFPPQINILRRGQLTQFRQW